MWIVRLALRRPYTFVVAAILILLLGILSIERTPKDIFPNIDIPVISVVWNYQGLSAEQMADRIITNNERAMTTTVNDIDHIESQSLDGVAVIKVFFHQGANVSTALAQITSISQTLLKQLPPGTTPPLIITYSASSVPVLQLGLSGKGLSEQQLYDLGNNVIRTQLANIEGASLPFPYGGKQRQIQVDLNMTALQSKGLSPLDVVNAISAQNLILPSGTAKIGTIEYDVEMNGSPAAVDKLNDLPIKTVGNSVIYIRDVAHVRDGYPPQTNIVRVNGQRSALMTIQKTGDASTLDIISRVKQEIPQIMHELPPQLKIQLLSDQSVFVKASITGVVREALIAACLTAAMILLFIGSWRSTLIIAVSIPLSILASIIVLSAIGQSINMMTLGGLALAVGILVDDATVAIENINRNLALGKNLEQAILDGSQEIAVPALVSTLSICIVFVPMVLLPGVARFLFVPLAEAVVFAMLASYLLSRTLVPTMAKYLLRGHGEDAEAERRMFSRNPFVRTQARFESAFELVRARYRNLLAVALAHRRVFVVVFVAACLVSFMLLPTLGENFFPNVDSGQIKLHLRARTGTRIEDTAALADQVESVIRQQIPPSEISSIIDNIGLPYSGINLSYSNSAPIGSEDADILVTLSAKHRPTEKYVNALRLELARKFPGLTFYFLPADMVTQILNFGLPAPIDVQVVGLNLYANHQFASQLLEKLKYVPGIADLRIQQPLNLPELYLHIDRTRTAQLGLTQREVASDVLIALSGSFQTSPTFWLDPKNGVSYNVAAQTPQYWMDSLQDLDNIPISNPAGGQSQILANLASIEPRESLEDVSHYNVLPVIDIYGAVEGRDLGSVSRDINRIVEQSGKNLPRGSRIMIRGQIQTMKSAYAGLLTGLVFSIVLVYLLIVVNFQSWLDPLILGHEITGEVIELGSDVEYIKKGDLVTVPFNVACGRCRTCRSEETGVCLNVNPGRAGGAYGYVDMGGWIGGQAEYVMVPYADFNLIPFPDKAQAMAKIRDLTMLTDILPTGFHGAINAGVGVGSTVYVAGAGPVGMASAASAHILGAAVVLVGDINAERLAHVKSVGYEPIDLTKDASLEDQIAEVLGKPEVDPAIDAVGFEAKSHGRYATEAPAAVLNSLMSITRAAGSIGIPGLYVTEDPGAKDKLAQTGNLSMRFGLGWAKSHRFYTGQTPVLKYNRQLMQAILHDRLPIAKIVNATVITLDDAPQGYKDFDKGAAKKFVIDPHNLIKAAA